MKQGKKGPKDKWFNFYTATCAHTLQDGWALQCATHELRGDRDIVLAAVSQTGSALEWASEKLRRDREIVRTAVSNHGSALQWASQESGV